MHFFLFVLFLHHLFIKPYIYLRSNYNKIQIQNISLILSRHLLNLFIFQLQQNSNSKYFVILSRHLLNTRRYAVGRTRCFNKQIKGSGAGTGVCYKPDQLREKSIQPRRSLRGQGEKERGTVAWSRFECKFNERVLDRTNAKWRRVS